MQICKIPGSSYQEWMNELFYYKLNWKENFLPMQYVGDNHPEGESPEGVCNVSPSCIWKKIQQSKGQVLLEYYLHHIEQNRVCPEKREWRARPERPADTHHPRNERWLSLSQMSVLFIWSLFRENVRQKIEKLEECRVYRRHSQCKACRAIIWDSRYKLSS